MKRLLLITALLYFGFAQGQNLNIPDDNFRQALLNHYPVIDTDFDGVIQISEAENFTGRLYVDGCLIECSYYYDQNTQEAEFNDCLSNCNFGLPIYDLTGIEAFINVNGIEISFVDIESIASINDIIISNYTNLELFFLALYSPETSSTINIDLSNNPNLKNVQIIGLNGYINQNLPNGEEISIDNLNIINSNNIEVLVLSSLEYTENSIEVSQLSNLDWLSIKSSNLQSIDVSTNTNLRILGLANTNFPTIDVSTNTNLERLDIAGNSFASFDVSNNLNLKVISFGNPNLTSVDLSNNINLERIYCFDSGLTSLDLSNNSNLYFYSIQDNLNLTYINAKNGNNNNSTFIILDNLPSLETVCVDDINSDFVTEIQNDVTQPVNFTEYCSLTPATSNQITGNVKYDSNANGCDVSDISLQNIMVTTTNGTDNFATFTQTNGDYLLYTNEGDFTTIASQNLPYLTVNPATQTSSFVGFDNTDTAGFCFEANQTISDVNIAIYPLTEARPGFDASYQIVYNNVGTTQLDGAVAFEFDSTKLAFLNASETVSSQTTNALTFNYTNFQPFESRVIDLNFNIIAPPTTQIDDVLVFNATANPVSGDNTTADNVYIFNQTVIGSFDPNDIQVVEGDQVLFADAGKYLHYIIRFQNEGTASAINIVVNNILDDKLDWNTLQLESTSHNSRVAITNGNDVEFIFENINLLDSTTDEPNSHGYITYKIKPKANVVLGDIITNKADIYFDFNEAIITNTVSTEFVNVLNVSDFNSSNFSVYPNPTTHILNIESYSSIKKVEIYNNIGQRILVQLDKNKVDVSALIAGLYFIKITDNNGASEMKKFIKR